MFRTYFGSSPAGQNAVWSFISVATGCQFDWFHQVVERDILVHANYSYIVNKGVRVETLMRNGLFHSVRLSICVQLIRSSVDGNTFQVVQSIRPTCSIDLKFSAISDKLEA